MTAYQVLGVDEQASTEEIRRAYQLLARQHHPDRARASSHFAGGKASFCRIQDAWELLRDSDRRRRYDAELQSEMMHEASLAGRTME
ncbi:MAG: hypothetical protein SGPRY_005113, partial [Prymnesium sp.]